MLEESGLKYFNTRKLVSLFFGLFIRTAFLYYTKQRSYMRILLACFLFFCCAIHANAQNATIISGTIKSNTTSEPVAAASVLVKGNNASGTYTDDRGNFKLSVRQSFPLTLVISSVGYATKEITVDNSGASLSILLEPAFVLGQEVVVSASRTPERILESPVTIERISTAAITAAPASSYYDIVGNLKGVDLVSSGLLYKTPSTRGFNISGNTRLNQLVDGMDNQAPGLNFPVGAIVGPTELDVESMELLGGASSALYGPGGMNGTLLINSKNPFKYQGLSVQVKGGVNHINDYARDASPYFDASLRWGKKLSDKFAFKINAEIVQAKDWVARDTSDYLRSSSSAGFVKPGQTRTSDANYDGVNVYGDETKADFRSILNGVVAGNSSLAPILQPFLNNPDFDSVSRTGYKEKDVIDPTTYNLKLGAGLYYMITPATELSFIVNHGNGNTVYTGSDRYSLKKLSIEQYKLEAKSKNWFLRAYTTQENAGESYNATVTMQLLNEAWAPSATVWYPRFTGAFVQGAATIWQTAYAQALQAGQTQEQAGAAATAATQANGNALLAGARAYADSARPAPGSAAFNSYYDAVRLKPIPFGGKFVDHTALYVGEGQWNLTDLLKLKTEDNRTDILVGGDYKRYVLNSEGTLFADTAGKIPINEYGVYLQASQKFFNVLRLTASGRYDKNENFKGRFTPRISAVVTVAKNNNIRLSYQTAYRFPTTQQQWINLTVGGNTKLIGGLPELRDFYGFNTNPAYSLASFQAFVGGGANNPALLQQQQFGEYKPESCESYEIGYKGLISNKLLIDAYAYTSSYKDFIGRIIVVQGAPPSGLATPRIFSVSVNSTSKVKTDGWGLSLQYLLPNNFTVGGNVYSDEIRDVSTNFISGFNAPKYRTNISFGNTGIFLKKQLGFNLVYKWQDKVHYESDFGIGDIRAFSTLDGQISYNLPKNKAIFKLGGTNLLNHYYVNGFGNPSIGALYYVSLTVNVL